MGRTQIVESLMPGPLSRAVARFATPQGNANAALITGSVLFCMSGSFCLTQLAHYLQPPATPEAATEWGVYHGPRTLSDKWKSMEPEIRKEQLGSPVWNPTGSMNPIKNFRAEQ